MKNSRHQREERGASPWTRGALAAAIALAIVLVFSFGITNEFVNWDDEQNFVKNPALRLPWSSYLSWAWSTRLLGVYQPVSWLFLRLTGGSLGATASVIHLVSVGLHAAICVLLFLTVLAAHRVLTQARPNPEIRIAAAIGTLWFALHPLRVEVVAWASCQPYLLASGFALLCTFEFLTSLEAGGTAGSRAWRWSVAWYAAAVLSKASVFALPAFMTITRLARSAPEHRCLRPRALLSAARADWPHWLLGLAAVGLALRSRTLGDSSGLHEAALPLVIALQPLIALAAATALTVLPIGLSPLYSLPSTGVAVACSAIVLGIAAWVTWRGPARARLYATGLVALFVPGVGSVMTERIAFADRITYLPGMLAAFGLSLWLAGRLRTARHGHWLVGSLAVLALLAWGSVRYLGVWHDSPALWRHALATRAPESREAMLNLATGYLDHGDFDAACESYERVRHVDPSIAEAQNGIGLCAIRRGDLTAAQTAFRLALRSKPAYADAMSNLAFVLNSRGEFQAALQQLENALLLSPDERKIHELRARVLEQLNRFPEAVQEWRYVIAADPGDGEAYLLAGVAMANQGDLENAASTLSTAVDKLPGNAAAKSALGQVLNRLGRPARP